MRPTILLFVLLPLAACTREGFSYYYQRPAEETTQERIDRKEIIHWKSDPRQKKRVGFLYKYPVDLHVTIDVGPAAVAVRVGGVERRRIKQRFDEQCDVVDAHGAVAVHVAQGGRRCGR